MGIKENRSSYFNNSNRKKNSLSCLDYKLCYQNGEKDSGYFEFENLWQVSYIVALSEYLMLKNNPQNYEREINSLPLYIATNSHRTTK